MTRNKRYASLKDKILDIVLNRLETKEGCWIADESYTRKDGYFLIGFKGKKHRMHRVLFEELILKQRIPDGLVVCHKRHCPNKDCFNPDHLYVGTQKDNIVDYSVKERYHQAKLNSRLARMIRSTTTRGIFSVPALAKMFHVSRSSIRDILRGRSYGWVK